MPRTAREKSGTGIYHMILRGINRQTIFVDDEDAAKFIYTLIRYKEKSEFILYAYCLMGNHVHMLVKEGREDLSIVAKRIGASYVYWYNMKYERCGHLFQDRYRSEIVEDDRYFLTVLRYIHQNPVQAGLVNEITSYPWSSYPEYLGKPRLIDINFVLEYFDDDKEKAIEKFKTFHEIKESVQCQEFDEKKKWKDSEAIELIKNLCQVNQCTELQNLDRAKQYEYIKRLCFAGLSARQLSRITGLGRWVIQNAIENR